MPRKQVDTAGEGIPDSLGAFQVGGHILGPVRMHLEFEILPMAWYTNIGLWQIVRQEIYE